MKKFKSYLISVLLLVTAAGFLACSSDKEVKPAFTDPETSLHKAQELLEEEKYDEARQLLSEVKGSDTTKKFAPLAQLKIAESYEKEGDYETAATEYRKFIELYPDSQYASFAQYRTAMAYFSLVKAPDKGAGSAKKALEEFQKLKALYPRNPYKDEVEARIRETRNIMADYEFLIGKFYFKKDSYKAALGRFLGIDKNFPDYKLLDEVVFYITLSYEKSGDKAEALKYFQKLRLEFPQSPYIMELPAELPAGK